MAIWQAEIKELGKLYGSLKGQFPDLEKELKQLIRNEDANVIMLYSRRCLEVIITNLCECELKRDRKTEPLKGIIDKLQKEGKVPSHIISSMHGLNELSTYGAHPKDFDPEQVKPVLINLAIIIRWFLKYKETGTNTKAKPVEEIRQETKGTEEVKKNILTPKRRLIGLVSSLILFIATVVAVLFFTKIIGGDKQIKELEKSIAVLPFINDSPSDSTTYFINGVMEEILNNLQKIKDFRILSRTSTERYKGTDIPAIPEIAKKLGVNYIVEGSGQKYGSTFRLRVQLIAANKERHLWAESYEKEIKETKDIFNIQNQIAQAIASQLKAIITPQEKQLIEKIPTKNLDAYNLYLQGRFFWNKRTEEGLKSSLEYFEKAIAVDSDYALAYAGLADAYFIQGYWGWLPWKEGVAKSKEAVLKALDIDKNLAEAHTVLGTCQACVQNPDSSQLLRK